MKILIVKPSSLGDIIHSLPLLNSLKTRYPHCTVDWVISNNLSGILSDHPLIHRLIPFNKDAWKKTGNIPSTLKEVLDFRRALKRERYDMVIDLQGLLRSGIITHIVSAPVKIGFRSAREGSRIFYSKTVPVNGTAHAVDRNLEIARFVGASSGKPVFPLPVDREAREKVRNLLGGTEGYAVIIPTARWKSKQWPQHRFSSLISGMRIPCVLTGNENDMSAVRNIIDHAKGKCLNLCGKTDLKGLVALIEGARVLVSADSGPMHIGRALGVPVVALFGPTDPHRTGPYGWQNDNDPDRPPLRVIRSGAHCSPCFRKRCSDPVCMTRITAEQVLEELDGIL